MSNVAFHSKITLYLYRLQLAWKILSGKHKHYVYVGVKGDQFRQMIEADDFSGDANVSYGGMQAYHSIRLLQCVGDCYDETDLILFKAEFQAEVELRQKGGLQP